MTIAIIDGDVLCYHACRPRWEKKAIDGVAVIPLTADGKRGELQFSKEEDRYYLEECWSNFKKDLENLLATVYCDEFVMAVGGGSVKNFRYAIYPEYKQNRTNNDPFKQNIFVPVMRKLAVVEDIAVEAHGCEADDMLRIWASQAQSIGKDFVICSIDKDLKCIPGKHYLMHKKTLIEITEEQALRHYYEQLLKGDPTDNIPGVPRVGEVKAAKILAPFNTEEEFQEQVVEQYMLAYGDTWRDHLLVNGKMIHIQKHPNDYFNFETWPIMKHIS